jgi:hypothetical protein
MLQNGRITKIEIQEEFACCFENLRLKIGKMEDQEFEMPKNEDQIWKFVGMCSRKKIKFPT